MSAIIQLGLEKSWKEAWEQEEFFGGSDEFFDALFAALNEAESSVIFATYIFDLDSLGRRIIHRLHHARERGVKIRVLFDGFGSMDYGEKVAKKLEKHGIEVKIFHPLPWHLDNYDRALHTGSRVTSSLVYLLKVNKRHHAKYCIIDNKVLWCGSQNITIDHLSSERGGKDWHDIGARVTGRSVEAIAKTFDDIWQYRKPRFGKGLFRYYMNNITKQARREKSKLLSQALRSANKKIWIINPYFSPTRKIIRAIKAAARQNVDVRLIVPSKSDIKFFPLLTSIYYDELLRKGVRIFEYMPAILHAKLLILDKLCLVGSTNLNYRSLFHDVEFDVVLYSEHARRSAENQFLEDQHKSREIRREDLKKMGLRRFLGWIPWLLRYWL